MRRYMLHRIFIFLTFCVLTNTICSQAIDNKYESYQQELTTARDGIDYSNDVIKKKEKEKAKKYKPFDFDFSNIAGALIIIILIILVGAILYFMIGRDNLFKPKSKKIKELNLESVEQIEENLEEHDVAQYLQQAIDNKQYRIAIRLHYLLIIKELSAKKLIKWKRDKTNRNYIYETESHPFSTKFKKSTTIFEKVWYGERNVTEQDFNFIYAQFHELNSEINQSQA